jgi:tRNA(Ile2) C34 agmatinyltransferase TiaS
MITLAEFTEDQQSFIKGIVKLSFNEGQEQALRIHDVSERSEQLVCDMCGSSKLEECGSNEYSCEECGHFPITN